MRDREKTLCLIGNGAQELPKTSEELETLRLAIRAEIDRAVAEGTDMFLTGLCCGFDLMAAGEVVNRRNIIMPGDPPRIKLIAVVPFEGQANKWSAADRAIYYDMHPLCDEVILLHTRYKNGCRCELYRWLVSHSDGVICYCGGGRGGAGYAVAYAEKMGLPVRNLLQQ